MLHDARGCPSSNFAEEAALLLRDGYLGTVDYGFLRHSHQYVEAAGSGTPRQPSRMAARMASPAGLRLARWATMSAQKTGI